jgi:hypothetical protein
MGTAWEGVTRKQRTETRIKPTIDILFTIAINLLLKFTKPPQPAFSMLAIVLLYYKDCQIGFGII